MPFKVLFKLTLKTLSDHGYLSVNPLEAAYSLGFSSDTGHGCPCQFLHQEYKTLINQWLENLESDTTVLSGFDR